MEKRKRGGADGATSSGVDHRVRGRARHMGSVPTGKATFEFPKLSGFTTASGKRISVNPSHLISAKQWLEEVGIRGLCIDSCYAKDGADIKVVPPPEGPVGDAKVNKRRSAKKPLQSVPVNVASERGGKRGGSGKRVRDVKNMSGPVVEVPATGPSFSASSE